MSVPFTKASQKRAKEYARIRGPPLPATHYTLSATVGLRPLAASYPIVAWRCIGDLGDCVSKAEVVAWVQGSGDGSVRIARGWRGAKQAQAEGSSQPGRGETSRSAKGKGWGTGAGELEPGEDLLASLIVSHSTPPASAPLWAFQHPVAEPQEMEALGYPLPKVLDYGTIIIPEGYIASSPGDGEPLPPFPLPHICRPSLSCPLPLLSPQPVSTACRLNGWEAGGDGLRDVPDR